MTASSIRAVLVGTHQRLAGLLAVLALAGAVIAHHGAPHGMGAMHGDHSMAAAAACVGTIAEAAAVVGLVATVARRRRPTWRPSPVLLPVVSRLAPRGPLPRARSRPLYLRYAVLRR